MPQSCFAVHKPSSKSRALYHPVKKEKAPDVWGDWKSGVFPHSYPMGSVMSKGLVKAGCESLLSFAGALVRAWLCSLAEIWGCWPREGRSHF